MTEGDIQQKIGEVQYAATSATGSAVINIYNYFYREDVKIAQEKPADTPQDDLPSPYRGLSYFEPNDTDWFYGRSSYIKELVSATKNRNFIPILGASGSGKSSLVFAGLIPELFKQKNWLFTYFRLGTNSDPFYTLAEALVPLYSDQDSTDRMTQATRLAQRLRKKSLEITKVFTSIQRKHPQHKLLLFADQFEQLYTSCDKEEQRLFLDFLLTIIQPPTNINSLSTVLVTTMRTDFLDEALAYQPFADAWKTDIKLTPMKPEELKEVIEEPALKLGVKFQAGLVKNILKDVSNQENQLPLLEFALESLWNQRNKRLKEQINEQQKETNKELTHKEINKELTHDDYDAIEEVKGALKEYAEEFYNNLNQAKQEALPNIFIKLVNSNQFTTDRADRRYVRRVAKKSEFTEVSWRLVQNLAEKRLVVTNRNSNHEDIVEIIHESLIREWARIETWMNENYDFRTWLESLQAAMSQWQKSDRDSGALLRGKPLADAEDWLQKHEEDLTNEREYIKLSLQWREREKAEKERQEREKLETQAALEAKEKETLILAAANQKAKKNIRYSNVYLAVSMFLCAVFLGWAAIAIHKQQEAQDGTKLEQAGVNALFQFKSGELSSLVSAMQSTQDLQKLIGNRNNPKDYPAVSPILALQKILDDIHEKNYFEAGQGEVKSAVFLPGDKGLITAGEGKENKEDTLQMWNLAGKEKVSLVGHEGGLLSGVNAVSVGGNAQNPVIASAGEDGTVRLWDKSGKQIRQLIAKGESFSAIAVSLDGQKIIAGQRNGTVYLWDKSGKQLLKTWAAHGSYVTAISFSKNGQTLATTGNDGLARIWTVTGNKLGELKHPQIKRMLGVSLSPDGKFVATASDDNRARIWTVNGQEVRRLEGHQGSVTVVNFSPDGQSVATGSVDGSVKLWDAKTGQNLQDFRGHRGVILSASFSADGKRLVSIAKDKFVRLWNLADTPVQRLELTGFKDDVNAIAFSPDGKTVAGAGNEGVMRQWDATSGKELKVWKEAIQRTFYSQNKVQDIAFSPDGKFIVAGGLRIGIARVWDLAGSLTEPKVRLKGNEDKPEAHRGDIVSVAFSPNRQLIATTGSYDKTMRIWNPKSPNGELVAKTDPQEKEMSRVLFIPGENQIVTGDGNGNVAIWDLAAKQISKWNVHSTQIRGLGITPDRSQIVTADKTGTVKISDRSRNKPKEFFSYQSGINELAISPNGKLIATGGMDGTVRLWDFHGRQVAEFRNPKGSIWAIAFSPDSQRIALAGNNGFVTIRRIDSLSDLMKNGCTWLQDYLALHPSEKNSLCP